MNYLNRMTEINTISDIIYDVKQNITDAQYKSIMDCLMKINNEHLENKKIENTEEKLTKDFFRHFFYHSHKNNNCFDYMFNKDDNSLWVSFDSHSTQLDLNNNHSFTYSKKFISRDQSIMISYFRIVRIMPHYSIINIHNRNKKLSNKTLAKLVYFYYIEFV